MPPLPVGVRYRMADCNLHLVDFLQHTDGIDAAMAAMDKCGVEDAVVSGMPVVKIWAQNEHRQPEYYLSDDSRVYWYSATDVLVAREVMSLPPDKRSRIHPVICGFMIGTDKVGHFADYPPEITKYYAFLDPLKPATANRLGRENLISVLPKAPAILSDEESAAFNGRLPVGTELMK